MMSCRYLAEYDGEVKFSGRKNLSLIDVVT